MYKIKLLWNSTYFQDLLSSSRNENCNRYHVGIISIKYRCNALVNKPSYCHKLSVWVLSWELYSRIYYSSKRKQVCKKTAIQPAHGNHKQRKLAKDKMESNLYPMAKKIKQIQKQTNKKLLFCNRTWIWIWFMNVITWYYNFKMIFCQQTDKFFALLICK